MSTRARTLQWLALLLIAVVVLVWIRQRSNARAPKAEVAIEDGKTIDFSSGKPVVKDSPQEQETIGAAVKEMESAARDVTFGAPAATKAP